MMHVLIVGASAGGNVPPVRATAQELLARGHQVTLAGFRDAPPSGATAIRLDGTDFLAPTRRSTTLRTVRDFLRLATSRPLATELSAHLDALRPDVVLVDNMMLSSVRAATESGVPTVVGFHSLTEYWYGGWARGPLGRGSTLRGLTPHRMWAAAAHRVAFTERALDPYAGAAAESITWTGTTEVGVPHEVSGSDPLVLVSLSSLWFPGQTEVYRRIIAALASLGVRAIVTTGGAELDGELAPAPGIEIHGRVAHATLLPQVSLVIGHGGHSTTLAALTHGVPVLIMPMHPLLDQPQLGRAAANAGYGMVLPKSSSPEKIATAVAALLQEPHYRAAVQAFAETRQLAGQTGAAVAADEIERTASLTSSAR